MLALLFVAAASQPASLPVYPEDWILKARTENRKLSCQELVYKRGCSEVRHGRVTLHVTLDAAGKVTKVSVLKNEVSKDPKLVEKCLLKNIKKWSFPPPENVSPELDLLMIFSDKC